MALSLEYIAGLFDGEGLIGIYRNGLKSKQLTVKVEISNTYLAVLKEVQGILGGRVGVKAKSSFTRQQCYVLTFTGCKQVEVLLTALRPFLRIKLEQATFVLDEWIPEIKKREYARGKPLSDTKKLLRVEMADQLKKMKRINSSQELLN